MQQLHSNILYTRLEINHSEHAAKVKIKLKIVYSDIFFYLALI